MKQGSKANFTGKQLEEFIDGVIQRKGYEFVKPNNFKGLKNTDRPLYTRQLEICKSIYNTPIRADFVIYHPDKHPSFLIIESKWQESGGSVDEKYPYLILNIKQQYPYAAIIVLDGGGYKREAEQWMRSRVDNKLVHVFNMAEFQKWANSEKL